MPRLLIVNPNSTVAMTEGMGRVAQSVIAEQAEIQTRTNLGGPAAIEGGRDGVWAGPGVLKILTEESYDAAIIGCFDDTALEAAQEVCTAPVIGIGQASFHAASLLGRRFVVVTTRQISVPILEDNLQKCGLWSRCSGIVASGIGVLQLERDPLASKQILEQTAEKTVQSLRPNVLVLGCAGMTGLADSLSTRLGIPVIDPIVAATSLALALTRMAATG
ncbi:MAG: aspartate/glutamate racemase family protein [Thermostichus sp. DG02_5_bins_236]